MIEMGKPVRVPGDGGYWTTGEIAKGVGCSVPAVQGCIDRRALPSYIVGRRHRRVRTADLRLWLIGQRIEWTEFVQRATQKGE